ncbi:uncharacterized protein LOC119262748 isoform X2 [Pygocentrus nattereri]|uniref:uncharacterized protein LOC119262748 isoform X2 n=1 Tax=Pygocentrus nattereri TaxID=42514 RepID=UPI0018919112|nr:uncharacterized protein LOC119262748 isoform X2 [Pygocentrus nattereri]
MEKKSCYTSDLNSDTEILGKRVSKRKVYSSTEEDESPPVEKKKIPLPQDPQPHHRLVDSLDLEHIMHCTAASSREQEQSKSGATNHQMFKEGHFLHGNTQAIICHRPLPYNKSLLSGQYLTRPHIAFRIQDKANRFYLMHLHHNNGKQGGTCPIRIHGHLRIQDKARMFFLIQMSHKDKETTGCSSKPCSRLEASNWQKQNLHTTQFTRISL